MTVSCLSVFDDKNIIPDDDMVAAVLGDASPIWDKLHTYFYGPYSKRYGQNTIGKTGEFDKPVAVNAKGTPKIGSGKIVATCFASDFFLPEADEWRAEAWSMIKQRQDLEFLILAKRIDRFEVSLPSDWGDGYENVNLGCTVDDFFDVTWMLRKGD